MPRNLLEPEFVQHCDDMTLSKRGEFATFMWDDRPQKDARYIIEHYIQSKPDDGIVVRGHLEDGDSDELFAFPD